MIDSIAVGGMEKELCWSGQKRAECRHRACVPVFRVWQKDRKKSLISVRLSHSFKGEGTQEVCLQTSSN